MTNVRLINLLSKKSIELELPYAPQQGDTLQVEDTLYLIQGITVNIDDSEAKITYEVYAQKINKQHWVNTLLDLKF